MRKGRQKIPKLTLEYQLCGILQVRAGERGHSEGAVDVLCRIIHERDRALTVLALDRLKSDPRSPYFFYSRNR